MSGANRARGSSKWLWPSLIGGIVVIGVVAIALGGGGKDNTGGSNNGGATEKIEIAKVVEVSGTPLPDFDTTLNDSAIGKKAPTLDGADFDGKAVTAGGASGKPQIVTFIAHWCPHCQREVPIIVDLKNKGVLDGVELTGVVTGTSADAPNYPPSAWLATEEWDSPVLVDTADATAGLAYGLTGYPLLVFVNPDGTVAGRWSGEMPESNLQAVIEAFKAGKSIPFPSN